MIPATSPARSSPRGIPLGGCFAFGSLVRVTKKKTYSKLRPGPLGPGGAADIVRRTEYAEVRVTGLQGTGGVGRADPWVFEQVDPADTSKTPEMGYVMDEEFRRDHVNRHLREHEDAGWAAPTKLVNLPSRWSQPSGDYRIPLTRLRPESSARRGGV